MPNYEKIANYLVQKVVKLEADNTVLGETLIKTTKVAEAAADALQASEAARIAADAGTAVKDAAAAAINPATTATVSAPAQEAIVEAVMKLDQNLGTELSDAIIEADASKEGVTGEKMANLTAGVINKLASKIKFNPGGTVRSKDKTAGLQNTPALTGADMQRDKLAELNAKLNSKK